MVFESGRTAVYVTPIGLSVTTAASPSCPVVPGTGGLWALASARPEKMTAIVEYIGKEL